MTDKFSRPRKSRFEKLMAPSSVMDGPAVTPASTDRRSTMKLPISTISCLRSAWVLLVALNGAHASSGGQRHLHEAARRIVDTAAPSSWFARRRNLSNAPSELKIELDDQEQALYRCQQRGLLGANRKLLSDLHRGGASGAAAAIKTMTSRQYEAFKYVSLAVGMGASSCCFENEVSIGSAMKFALSLSISSLVQLL
jgi:hypothetical protein